MASPSNKLKVRIIRAEGLQHLNHFTGDNPYVTCGIKRADGKVETKVETKPVTEGDTLNPIWDETLELEPWQPGETLEFIVYDKGLLGSKTEGKAILTGEFFYPNGFQGTIAIIGLPDAKLSVEVQVVGAQDGEALLEQAKVSEGVAVPQKLGVSILQAHGLKHMNNFTGDNPYVTCEVKHLDPATKRTCVETKPMAEGDTLNPFWGETHDLEPWFEGESLEFTVYDRGLVASKTEGKVVLPSDIFFPQGISGMVAISGQPHALLHVIVRPLGPLMASGETAEDPDPDASSKKKEKKKLKVSKKSKHCC